MKAKKDRQGFTLMEVLLVLAILVVLASLSTIFIRRMQQQADIRATEAEIANLKKALVLYQIDMKRYPTEQDGGLQALVAPPADQGNSKVRWGGPYLENPVIPTDSWGKDFIYTFGEDRVEIRSLGPDGADNTGDEIIK